MHKTQQPNLAVACTRLCLTALLALSGNAIAQNWSAIGAGELLLQTDNGVRPAAALATQVRMVIRGPVARVEVTQRFTNNTQEWIEGIYAFPLPEDAAVDRLRLKIGARLIEGEIHEKRQAQRIYTQARSAGKRAVLVEQHRPNLFTTRVANIAPGDTIEVLLAYVQPASWRDGAFSLRFPMTITPRYKPGAEATGRGSPVESTPASPKVSLEIWLDAGGALADIISRYHAIHIEQENGWHHVQLSRNAVIANRDFVLTWTPKAGSTPQAAAFAETVNGETYALLMLTPPKLSHSRPVPREVIFIMDTSGSMHGESIQQAKTALEFALRQLGPNDRFNVIRFSTDAQALFPHPVAADDLNIGGAVQWVKSFQAEGGTEMAPALELALRGQAPRGYLRQIVFLTDGAVGNERALLKLIHQRLGESRLFTIGIGAAPNTYFMREAAKFGRGSFTYIADITEVKNRMAALLTRLTHPVLQDICINWPRASTAYPHPVPDLYAGEPVIVYAKLSTLDGVVDVCGKRAGLNWRDSVKLANSSRRAGIAKLWARRKIESLMDSRITGADPKQVRTAVIETALRHHLISPYTSLVAVDKTPARTRKALQQRRIANAAPAGWAKAASLPQTATTAPLNALLGLVGLLLAVFAWWLGRPPKFES